MVRDELSVLGAFLMVAQERSFTAAAKRLGVTTSALSHAIKGLEEQLDVRLLARTTRSVAPTDAGQQLIDRLAPALADITGALGQVKNLRQTPKGRVRLVLSPLAATMIVGPRLGLFARKYPEVSLEVTTTNEVRLDLVAGDFDAGIHLGEFIERDMIAVKVSPDQRAAVVGSPAFFESHPKPKTPRDLNALPCINFRHSADEIYRWEFDKGKKSLGVAVHGALTVDNVELQLRGAIEGVGLAYVMEEDALPFLKTGQLIRVLEDWCPPFDGYYMYYPSRKQQPAALAALIDTLRS